MYSQVNHTFAYLLMNNVIHSIEIYSLFVFRCILHIVFILLMYMYMYIHTRIRVHTYENTYVYIYKHMNLDSIDPTHHILLFPAGQAPQMLVTALQKSRHLSLS